MANVEAYNTGLTEAQIDEALSNALNTYTKTEEDALLGDKADTAAVFGTGTLIPDDGDLFTLPVGKYYRNSNPGAVANIPSDLTVEFYCEIVNTIADNRRKIYLYPATVQTEGVFYTCLETSSGYGTWYKFTGEAVV